MADFFNGINNEINWYLTLDKADFLVVTAFLICALFIIGFIIWLIVRLLKLSKKPPLDIIFKLEDFLIKGADGSLDFGATLKAMINL